MLPTEKHKKYCVIKQILRCVNEYRTVDFRIVKLKKKRFAAWTFPTKEKRRRHIIFKIF